MKNLSGNYRIYLVFSVLLIVISACHKWDNFTTYYNTYYNIGRLMNETEDQFDFIDEKKRTNPNVYVPQPDIYIPASQMAGPPPFMADFVISQQERQPVEVKLDSIEIKGSKILAFHPQSDYIEGTLYQMSKAYFYRGDWINSQIKCSELIDKYPDGEWSADAHLLMAENYLIQRKFLAGKLLLSRCVDIAWQKERYDILSEAFRLQAELAIFEEDPEGAVRPYKQAIAQADNDEMRARWQVDLGAILYRMAKFERAEKEFAKARLYSPDYLAEFESWLYQAACMTRMKKFDQSEKILEDLEGDRKNEEWLGYIFAERLNILRLQNKISEIEKVEKFADSAYMGNPAINVAYFEIGMDYFKKHDYIKARTYFARSKNTRSPIFRTSEKLYALLNQWDQKRIAVLPAMQKLNDGKLENDTAKTDLGKNLFELGRVHDQLGNKDSAIYYYKTAMAVSPPAKEQTARFIYAYALSIKDSDAYKSDSLLRVIVENYPTTPFGADAIKRLGFTDAFVIDTVAELYKSGNNLRKFGDYAYANSQFLKIFNNYPKSDYAPKGLYSIGWIFENPLNIPDSALFYYQLLIQNYPQSEYAADVKLSVAYLTVLKNGLPMPDSLKQRKVVAYQPPKPAVLTPPPGGEPPKETPGRDKLNPMDLLNDPSKFFKGAKDQILNGPKQMIKDLKDIKLPTSPEELMKLRGGKQDSTGTVPPGPMPLPGPGQSPGPGSGPVQPPDTTKPKGNG